MARPTRAALVLALLPAAALAQEDSGALFARRAATRAAFERWSERHGGGWHSFEDRHTGCLEFLGGGHTAARFAPQGDEDFAALAQLTLEDAAPLFGLEPATLAPERVRFLPLGLVGGTDKVAVRFRQQVAGVPVLGGTANVLFDLQGRALAVQATALPGVADLSVRPTLDADRAAARAREDFAARTGLPGALVGAPRLGIGGVVVGGLETPRLVWEVEVRWEAPGVVPEGLVLWIDAHDGAALRARPGVHELDVGGTLYSNASPGSAPDEPANPPALIPIPYARVTSGFSEVYTDMAGNFLFPGAAPGLTATFEYYGDFADVDDDAGLDYLFSQQLFGTGVPVVMNPTPTEAVTAQANAYVHVARLRDWIRAVDPTDDTADFRALARVNLQATCNAYFDGSSVNFFAAGGGCVNTAYATVVAHEMGHWLNVLYGTGNGNDGMGEGNSDVFATYLFDTPVLGEGFFGPGTEVRNATNTRMFCGDCCPGCHGGGVHTEGQVWMGAAWKLRERLDATHGNALGDAIADALFSGWMNAFDQTQIKSVIELQWLVLDDDNGFIDDGTPNYPDIDGGFRDQGFPGFDLPAILFLDVTELPDTVDEAGPYQVDATVVPQAAGLIGLVELHYRVSGGAWQTLTMPNVGGDDYRAFLPGQLSPATVDYYVSALDVMSNTLTFPATAPEEVLQFHVGVLHVLFFDDFEGPDDGGWTHGSFGDTGNAHDDFQRGAPAGLAGDPQAAASGEHVWGNDLGGGAWNGLYQNNQHNWLRSPVIDASGAVNTELRFNRWLTVEDALHDVARVTVAGVEIWRNDDAEDTLDTGWVEQSFDVSALADGEPALQVEFTLATDAATVAGGWNLDDVELRFLTPVGGAVGAPYCAGDGSATPCPCSNPGAAGAGCANSSGAGATLAGAGSTSAALDDLTLDAAWLIPGQPALLFVGLNAVNGGAGVTFGDGLRCAGGSVLRLGVQTPSGSGAAGWGPGLRATGGWGAGDVRRFQCWYRDPSGGPCGAGFNLSNGLELTFTD